MKIEAHKAYQWKYTDGKLGHECFLSFSPEQVNEVVPVRLIRESDYRKLKSMADAWENKMLEERNQ